MAQRGLVIIEAGGFLYRVPEPGFMDAAKLAALASRSLLSW